MMHNDNKITIIKGGAKKGTEKFVKKSAFNMWLPEIQQRVNRAHSNFSTTKLHNFPTCCTNTVLDASFITEHAFLAQAPNPTFITWQLLQHVSRMVGPLTAPQWCQLLFSHPPDHRRHVHQKMNLGWFHQWPPFSKLKWKNGRHLIRWPHTQMRSYMLEVTPQ